MGLGILTLVIGLIVGTMYIKETEPKEKIHIGQTDYDSVDDYLKTREAMKNYHEKGKRKANVFVRSLGLNNETMGEQLVSQLLRDYGNKKVSNQTKQDLEASGQPYAETEEAKNKLSLKEIQGLERVQTINSYKHYMIKNYGTKSKPKLTRKAEIVKVLTSEYTKGESLEADYAVMKLENNSVGKGEAVQSYLIGGEEITPLQIYINVNDMKVGNIAKSIYNAHGERKKDTEYMFKVQSKYEAPYEIKKLNSVVANTHKERKQVQKDKVDTLMTFVKQLEKQTNSKIGEAGYKLIEKELRYYIENKTENTMQQDILNNRPYEQTIYKMLETYGLDILKQELNIASERYEVENG